MANRSCVSYSGSEGTSAQISADTSVKLKAEGGSSNTPPNTPALRAATLPAGERDKCDDHGASATNTGPGRIGKLDGR